jgi:hypothetical protein
MNHGITQAKSLAVSRKAGFERKLSNQSIHCVNELIKNYEREIKEYKFRIQKLEAAEIKRLSKEVEYKEELANNHGKPKSYFKVPALFTRVRSSSRRIRKLRDEQEEDKAEL